MYQNISKCIKLKPYYITCFILNQLKATIWKHLIAQSSTVLQLHRTSKVRWSCASFSANRLARDLELTQIGKGATAFALDSRVGLKCLQSQTNPWCSSLSSVANLIRFGHLLRHQVRWKRDETHTVSLLLFRVNERTRTNLDNNLTKHDLISWKPWSQTQAFGILTCTAALQDMDQSNSSFGDNGLLHVFQSRKNREHFATRLLEQVGIPVLRQVGSSIYGDNMWCHNN